ncbi:glycosyltransferase family 34 protein [Trichoderma citrinoviride]|uniref:Glycosyltransferase family 34 protein n=1 Tax=Trichoderma citrinoviride TaxID=58853 RepID=A0A2T4B129_9HYPO|nr:glycosyltransferase family 34 protein [Trichoderma citrinoviride]PTB63024.1 glycosyltransferase family 34 protein [Trichoderma citrinoviride]
MHFAYPSRKSSNPPPFRPRSTRLPGLRRSRIKTIGIVLFLVLATLWLFSNPRVPRPDPERVPSGRPPVVLVTVIDPTQYPNAYLKTIKENREQYAAKHGYEAFIVKAYDYDTQGAPQSWSKLMAMRHALSKFPECRFVWYLDQDAYIMDMNRSLEEQLLNRGRLESLMIKNYPVVPPDSIIKTFSHLRADEVDLIVSQDSSGLVAGSIVVRNSQWGKFLLETWMDPLYRSYNFQKAERHALEHIVQWHPTILSKLALVPQRALGPYTRTDQGDAYQDGDFVVMFTGCAKSGPQSCETESANYYQKWSSSV